MGHSISYQAYKFIGHKYIRKNIFIGHVINYYMIYNKYNEHITNIVNDKILRNNGKGNKVELWELSQMKWTAKLEGSRWMIQ